MDLLAFAVLGLLAIAAATSIGSRLGIAAPLLLTILGLGISLLPFVWVTVEPEWILEGVLPPLLYSAAVSMPTMEFRRDFTTISGLSIVLVVISSLLLGWLFSLIIASLGLAGGIALGAIISPTDAVATSIVKRLGVSPRAVALLEGEGLLNDATALVLLRSALVGMAATVSLWTVVGDFLYAVLVAVVIGWVVGKINLQVRARVVDSAVNTAISFTIPFLAAIPAEHFGASGLVAAVVAGLVTGKDAPRFLSPRHRLSDSQNWRTIELMLEGAVFLIMGLELTTLFEDMNADYLGIGFGIAAITIFATVLIRAAYVAPLLVALKKQAQRGAAYKANFSAMKERMKAMRDAQPASDTELLAWRERFSPQAIDRFRKQMQRRLADLDYMLAEPLGWREGAVVVWAGMRGVVTLAAAQTLPEDMPNRSLLIFIAFLVAVGSLLIQGSTLPWLIDILKPKRADEKAVEAEQKQLQRQLEFAAIKVLDETGETEIAQRFRDRLELDEETLDAKTEEYQRIRKQMIDAQRNALLDARDDGEYSATALNAVLATLDADQISLELRPGAVSK